MKHFLVVVVLLIAVVGIGATGCNQKKEAAPQPTASADPAAEFKAEYKKAKETAKKWQDNATLERVYRVYNGTISSEEPQPVIFAFSSLAEATKVYQVTVPRDGEPRTEKKQKQDFEILFNPLSDDVLAITPDDALQKAEDAGGKTFREQHLAGYRVLQQLASSGKYPAQWLVRYDTGDASKLRLEIYLNAKTGEVETKREKRL
jgi:hypothetical protein